MNQIVPRAKSKKAIILGEDPAGLNIRDWLSHEREKTIEANWGLSVCACEQCPQTFRSRLSDGGLMGSRKDCGRGAGRALGGAGRTWGATGGMSRGNGGTWGAT